MYSETMNPLAETQKILSNRFDKHLKELEVDGLTIIPNVVPPQTIELIKEELIQGIAKQDHLFPNAPDKGMLHNPMCFGEHLAQLLCHPLIHEFIGRVLSPTFILYAYQGLSMMKGKGNAGTKIHVDSPRLIDNYVTNVNAVIPLVDFTKENGSTYFLKGSHKSLTVPQEDHFYQNAIQGICKKGDMVVFNARLFHAGGVNRTQEDRHALGFNFCRSYMRQRFYLPRLISKEVIEKLDENGKRLIGMRVRMPTSLEEFYLPEDQRLYKSNQG